MSHCSSKIQPLDQRRNIAILNSDSEAVDFSAQYFIELANAAIAQKQLFTVALSGGSTPKAIFEKLAQEQNRSRIDWSKVLFFFGDERSVPPTDGESNYKMAMDSFLKKLEIAPTQIFRMVVEKDPTVNAKKYEQQILEKVPNAQFDFIMLGMGDDGHTASLFPHTGALAVQDQLVTTNFVAKKNTLRMTLTYPCINQAHHICFFAFGKNKAEMVAKVLQGADQPLEYPSQKVGTQTNKALWILDQDSAARLKHPC